MTSIGAPIRVVIDLGQFEGETIWRYMVALIFHGDPTFAGEIYCGISDRLTHAEALRDAQEAADEDDLEIEDRTTGRLQ
jgi:hypothetical protein